ncbi:hypothetical protein NM688_g5998 [Phlebia brevispora]|uniref:Uncharacterized protein n=1 Tax=Phlebia brevispora TaxID=194682 RepID=A0ACC1SLH9_9APHY|nr:hypothetical protein NM688_g5998 [Phlebia brevispora]
MESEKQASIHATSDSKSDIEVLSPTPAINELSDTSDAIDAGKERKLVRRIDLRLIPSSMFIYLLCFLDRSNIGNAKVLNSDTGDSLMQSLNISNQQYLVALMIFIVAYTLFETPSNYLLKKFAPSRWIPVLMLGWGLMTMVLGAVNNFAELVVVRFLLGVFEAGLFPGILYCLTFWYKPNERALRMATITAASLPASACYLYSPSIPTFPKLRVGSSTEERALAVGRIKGVSSLGHARISWAEAKETLLDVRLYLHYLVYITLSVPFSSISLFSPTIVAGLGYEGLQAQLFTVPPYAIAFVVTLTVAWQSDKHNMRSLGACFSLLIAGVAFLLQGALQSQSFKARYGLLCVAVTFSFACTPPILSWLAANLRNTGAMTLAIPLNVSFGQIGQIVGVYIYKNSEAPRYQTGNFTNAAFLIVGAVLVLVLRSLYKRRNERLGVGEHGEFIICYMFIKNIVWDFAPRPSNQKGLGPLVYCEGTIVVSVVFLCTILAVMRRGIFWFANYAFRRVAHPEACSPGDLRGFFYSERRGTAEVFDKRLNQHVLTELHSERFQVAMLLKSREIAVYFDFKLVSCDPNPTKPSLNLYWDSHSVAFVSYPSNGPMRQTRSPPTSYLPHPTNQLEDYKKDLDLFFASQCMPINCHSEFSRVLRIDYQQTPRFMWSQATGDGHMEANEVPDRVGLCYTMESEKDASAHATPDSKSDIENWSPTADIDELNDTTDIADAGKERKLIRRIDLRLVPSSMFIYFLCFLDRSNIGNAKILNSDTGDSLMQSLNISDQQYLVALMIFIVAYTLFETPSNYLLKKFAPSRWLPVLMLGWGLMTMVLGAVNNFAALVVVRFLLGVFEAGLFPGILYCLTFWYKPNERALRMATITACATLGGAFGGAIAFGVGHMDHVRGLEAWRWLFILEGIPSCVCALLVFAFYPDFPETARWLSTEERALAVGRIKGVSSLGHARITWAEAKETLLDARLYLHYLAFIVISVPFSSISLFAPTIVSGLGYEGLQAQLFTVPPYAIAFVVTLTVAWQSDKHEMRCWGAFYSLLIAGVAFLLQGALHSQAFKARYGLLCVAVPFSFASIPPLLSWLAANLRNTGAMTLAIPLNVSIGQIGQIVGVYIYKSSEAPRYQTGHFTNAAFLIMGSMVVLVLRALYRRRNQALAIGERRWQL